MNLAAVATAAGVAYALGWLTRQPEVAAARREASTDALTGLMNRAGLKHQLQNRAKRRLPYTLYMLDLNGFKPINDQFGHRAGDELLTRLGERLRAQLAGHLVVRLGGDEFMVLTDGPQTPAESLIFCERIARAVSTPVLVPGSATPVVLTTAIGAVRAAPGADFRGALHAADQAMYLSKATGRPRLLTATTSRPVDESPRSRVRDRRPVRVA